MGQVHNRSGRWYVIFKDGAGRRRHLRVPGTRKDAEKALHDLESRAFHERERLSVGGPGDPTIEAVRAAWKAEIVTTRRPRTWESYELGLDQVLGWLDARAARLGLRPVERLSDLRIEDVRAFAAERLGAGMSRRTIDMRVGAVRAMGRWAVARGLAVCDPLALWRPLRGEPRRKRRALSEWEIVKLLQASESPFRELWRFLLATGLRVGELAALEWTDVDLAEGTLTVRAEVSKSRRSRDVPLRPELVDMLRRMRGELPERRARAQARLARAEARRIEADTDREKALAERAAGEARRAVHTSERHVFVNEDGGRWTWNLARRLKPCLRKAGLDEAIDLHTLRHTFGSHLIAGGVDVKTVQDLLGHSSAMVTLDCYAHAFGDRKRAAVGIMPLPGAVALAHPERTEAI